MLIYAQTMCKIYRYNSEGNQRVKEYLVSTLSEQYADKFSPRRISCKCEIQCISYMFCLMIK